MPRACVLLSASRSPNRRVFRRSQILALGTAYFLIYRLGSSLRPPRVRAEELRRTHFDLVFHGRPALSLRACMAPDQTVLCQLRPGAPSNPSIFQRYPCSHYGRLRVVQPFRAPALQNGSCALRPEQLRVYRSNNFCASPSRSATWSTYPQSPRRKLRQESLWATSPPRKMALGPLQASHWPPKMPPSELSPGLCLADRGL